MGVIGDIAQQENVSWLRDAEPGLLPTAHAAHIEQPAEIQLKYTLRGEREATTWPVGACAIYLAVWEGENYGWARWAQVEVAGHIGALCRTAAVRSVDALTSRYAACVRLGPGNKLLTYRSCGTLLATVSTAWWWQEVRDISWRQYRRWRHGVEGRKRVGNRTGQSSK